MATITFYLTNGIASSSNHHALQQGGTPPALLRLITGWIVGTTTGVRYARMAQGAERASTALATTAEPSGAPNNAVQTSAGDCFRSPATLNDTFQAGTWDFTILIAGETRATSTHDGAIRIRLWRSTSATGAGATEITAGVQTTSQYLNLANTAYQALTLSVSLGAVTMSNEYLFLQVALRHDTAGGATAADTHIGIGTSGTSTSALITPNFGAVIVTESGQVALGGSSAPVLNGVRMRTGALAAGGLATVSSAANAIKRGEMVAGGTSNVTATAEPLGAASLTVADDLLENTSATGTRTATATIPGVSIGLLLALRPADAGFIDVRGSSTPSFGATVIRRGQVGIAGKTAGRPTLVPRIGLTPSTTLVPSHSQMFFEAVNAFAALAITGTATVIPKGFRTAKGAFATAGGSSVSFFVDATQSAATQVAGVSSVGLAPTVIRSGTGMSVAGTSGVSISAQRLRRGAFALNGAANTVHAARAIYRSALTGTGVASVSVARRAIYRGALGSTSSSNVRFTAFGTGVKAGVTVINGAATTSFGARRIAAAVLGVSGGTQIGQIPGRVRRATSASVGVSAVVLPINTRVVRGGVLTPSGLSGVAIRGTYTTSGRLQISAGSTPTFNAGEILGTPLTVPSGRLVRARGGKARVIVKGKQRQVAGR